MYVLKKAALPEPMDLLRKRYLLARITSQKQGEGAQTRKALLSKKMLMENKWKKYNGKLIASYECRGKGDREVCKYARCNAVRCSQFNLCKPRQATHVNGPYIY